jgi:uncharacterized repeat protein (TIGR03803 family)
MESSIRLLVVAAVALATCASIANAAPIRYLHHFEGTDGGLPVGGLVTDGRRIYGTTTASAESVNTGEVFAMDLDGQNFEILHVFPLDSSQGKSPEGRMTLVDDVLYGTTIVGGPGRVGTIFSVRTDGNDFRLLHSFDGGTDGANPFRGLTHAGGRLFGTTNGGGADNWGTVYSIDLDGSDFEVLHAFADEADGRRPVAAPVPVGTRLIGTAHGGRTFEQPEGGGVVYSVNQDGTDFEVIRYLDGGTSASVTLLSDYLYGATSGGGSLNAGRVYRVRPDGDEYEILHEFDRTDGRLPSRDLVTDGTCLYGTTFGGGATGGGVVYAIDPDGSNFRVLHHFLAAPDGDLPGPLWYADGWLFGVTEFGGLYDLGSVFAIPVPEPSAAALGAASLLGLVFVLRHSRRVSRNSTVRRLDHDEPGRTVLELDLGERSR